MSGAHLGGSSSGAGATNLRAVGGMASVAMSPSIVRAGGGGGASFGGQPQRHPLHDTGDGQRAAAGGGGDGGDPNDFSFRTLPVSDHGSSDDEAAARPTGAGGGTPPRPIERSPAGLRSSTSSTPMTGHHHQQQQLQHMSPSAMDTPLHQRPPLHPNVSPIYSPSRGGAQAPSSKQPHGDFQHYQLLDGYADEPFCLPRDHHPFHHHHHHLPQQQQQHGAGGSAGSAGSTSRGVAAHHPPSASATAAARPIASLDEAVLNAVFPLFAQFLRTMAPQQLEALLVAADPNGGGGGAHGCPFPAAPAACQRWSGDGGGRSVGSPAQLAEAVIPPVALVALDCGVGLGEREFSYYRPAVAALGGRLFLPPGSAGASALNRPWAQGRRAGSSRAWSSVRSQSMPLDFY